MRIRGKILVLRLISCAQKAREHGQPSFFLRFNLLRKLHLLNVRHNFLLSDVLHCTNINTDLIDITK